MTVLNAHFEGKTLVLDDPVPENLPAGAKVRVVVEQTGSEEAQPPAKGPATGEADGPRPSSLRAIAQRSIGGLPRDFSTQFKHYTKGTPRR